MSKDNPTFSFKRTARKGEYTVTAIYQDGRTTVVGTVRRFVPRHIPQIGWEAAAADGHRGVHNNRWQAAEALVVNLAGYPFPILKRAA